MFVLAICLGHLGIIVLFVRSPATSNITAEDEPIMSLTFFDEPRHNFVPKVRPEAGHSAHDKESRNPKPEGRTDASLARPEAPADVSAAAPQELAPGIDWMAEAQHGAQDYISRTTRGDSHRAMDGPSSALKLLRSRAQIHRLGDTEHYDGGEIIDWIDDRCYYSNRDPNGNLPPMRGVTGLAPLYMTGKPICKPR